MSDKPQVGDKVRVSRTYEDGVELTWTGIVDSVSSLGLSFRNYAFMSKNYSFEILERAKPKWQDGDVCIASNGRPRFRIGGSWWTSNQEIGPDVSSSSGWKLVMRDGRPV